MWFWPNGQKTPPTITDDWGYRDTSNLPGVNPFHHGIDTIGHTYAYAVADGTVLRADRDSVFGNYVLIDHGGRIWSKTNHLAARAVRQGDTVYAGTTNLGPLGATGLAFGIHLHFEIWAYGVRIDPYSFLADRVAASASGGSTPFPTPDQMTKLRSPDMEIVFIKPVGSTVAHIVPGVRFEFDTATQYNTWRRQVDGWRASGAAQMMPLPELEKLPKTTTATYRTICSYYGVNPA